MTNAKAPQNDDLDDLLTAAENAAAVISAVYQWLEMVEAAGGATSLTGVAKCHAFLKSPRNNKERTETLVMRPLRAALSRATGDQTPRRTA